jgi:hypothetical protein
VILDVFYTQKEIITHSISGYLEVNGKIAQIYIGFRRSDLEHFHNCIQGCDVLVYQMHKKREGV